MHFQSERKKVKKTKSFKAVRFSGSDMIDDVMDLKPEEEKPSKSPKIRKGSKKQKQKEKENTEKSKVVEEKKSQETEKPDLEKSHSEGILTNAVEVKQTTLQVISCRCKNFRVHLKENIMLQIYEIRFAV